MIEARRSIFSRLVVLAIALSIAVILGLWFVTHQTVRATIEDAARSEVDVDIAGLVDIYSTSGEDELRQRISDRLALIPTEGSTPHYLLARDNGAPISGDIPAWPALDAAVSETGMIPIGENSTGFARAVQLGPNLKLLVARRTDRMGPLLTNIAWAFALGGAVFVALVALLGRIAAISLQRRIGQINLAFRNPDADAQLVISNGERGDEIDELAAHSADALNRQRLLAQAYKSSSEQIAHEIRTPLSHLDGRLLTMLRAEPTPQISDGLTAARTDIKQLVQVLESLLDIASSKARRGDKSGLREFDFSATVSRICDLYSESATDTGHSLEWDIMPEVMILGDESQLTRLVTNLLDNALKYVPSGGRIEVRLEQGPMLTISDDGPGIAPEDRARIFERFYRGRNSGQSSVGSGLGLSLAQAIAERHGLDISLDEPEQSFKTGLTGAVFRIGRAL